MNASIDTCWAKIVVATIADAAMVVLVLHGMIAVVAVHHPRGAHVVRLGAECEISII
jgi:hypothetical protein